ncbi:MAG: hypothetical protein Q9198_004107 [Flavoplaca austrocitrina]
MDKDKAQELINQLQDNHKEQIQCLQALFGLASQGQAKEDQDKAEQVEGDTNEHITAPDKSIGVSFTTSALPTSAIDDVPLEKHIQMPAEWALPWSNALLNQRIRERRTEPGPVVDPTDSAASFIADNALTDLARFKFGKDSTNIYGINFYVIDYDQRRQIVLDTGPWVDNVLQKLMKQVLRSPITIRIGKVQANIETQLEDCWRVSS